MNIAMEVVKCCLVTVMFTALACTIPVLAQDQSGFISIDCGIAEGTHYTDANTNIYYVSDANFTKTAGVNYNISSNINATNIDRQLWNVRSFPDGTKNCYTLNPKQGKNSKYLIRAWFLYGNYDNKSDVPEFDLYLGVNYWDTIRLSDALALYSQEIIHVLSSDSVDICLVNTGFGTPFISALELRILNSNTYVTDSGSLELYARADCGLTSDKPIRFPSDVNDRIWLAYAKEDLENLSTTSTIQSQDLNSYQVPSIVMETAFGPLNNSYPIYIPWARDDPTNQFYIYMHFAEIQQLEANQSREFNIYLNDRLWYGPLVPRYLQTTTINSTSAEKGVEFEVIINKTENSTLPPLLNALEVYLVKDFSQLETYQEDVEAIINIKQAYKVDRHWEGDPCLPETTIWKGLNCSYRDQEPPRIIYLDLSSSGLTGQITPSIANLEMLQYLDLSNNSLNGPVPSFLSQLQSLRVLNLTGNKISGQIPQELIARSKNGTLLLILGKTHKNKFIVPVATIGAVLFLFLTAIATFRVVKSGKQGEANGCGGALKSKDRHFAYTEILNITNNLERAIGSGKSGKVYHGYFDDAQVAIKIFSPSCFHGHKQFRANARLLTGIHHRNLVTYFGYCQEGSQKGLICEFMENGNLENVLSGRNVNFLTWQERLQIAIDVAQGLEYLHNAAILPIIHGNLKPTNILLNENFQAKLSDFGLSKMFTIENGTTEYLDPEYHVTNKLTERSDIYSFGILLLAIITSQPVIDNNPEKTHITRRVNSLLSKGDIKSVVDSRLQGDFHVDSVWRAVELAMACVSPTSVKRPGITHVLMELNQCLAMEITRISKSEGTIELVSVNLGTGVRPLAR